MKKAVFLVLALALCCALIPCSAEDASLTGTWYLSRVSTDLMDTWVTDNSGIILTLHEDHSCTLSAASLFLSGTWSLADTRVFLQTEPTEYGNPEPVPFRLEGDELVADLETARVFLSRTPDEPVSLSPAVKAESADSFSGDWTPFAQMSNGLFMLLNERDLEMVPLLRIDGSRIMTRSSDSEQKEPTGEYKSVFTDGMLTAEDNRVVPTAMTFSLREDGTLFYTEHTDLGDMFTEITLIYNRAEPAE